MSFTRKTIALVALAVALGAIDALPDRGASDRAALPETAALSATEITRITLQKGADDKTAIEPDAEGGWRVVGPYEAEADEQLVRRLVSLFKDPLELEARLDEGNLESYRLDYEDGVVVELFAGGETPALSFVVGADASGGSSFIRLANEDAVYRARVGGRHRYDQPASAWKDRDVLDVAPDDVLEIEVAIAAADGRDEERFRLQRAGESDWSVVGDPEFPLDGRTAETLLRTLVGFRAGEVLSSDFDAAFEPPAVAMTLYLSGGQSIVLEVGERYTENASFVRRTDRPAVYRVARGLRARLIRGLDRYRELTLVRFDAAELATLTLDEGALTIVAAQSAPGEWSVQEPANVDLDPRALDRSARAFGDLRADAVAGLTPAEAGMDRPALTLTAAFTDGSRRTLEVGVATADERGQRLFYVRLVGEEAVYLVREATLSQLRLGFGRGQ